VESGLAIAYQQADLMHLPIRYDRERVQQLFYDMSRKLYSGYKNLGHNLNFIDMFTIHGQGGSSRLQLLPDRFRIIEHNSGLQLDDFKSRFEVVMASAANVFGVSRFPVQNVKLRSVAQPTLWDNGVQFLATKICGLDEDDLAGFGRRPAAFQMQFTFVATPEDENAFTLKIESYSQPERNVVMDVDGTFPGSISTNDIARGAENIQKTHDFVSARTMDFLNRFDRQPEP
jgi:hypothetical protein